MQLAEELETARTTYGALNSQLVDELPVNMMVGMVMVAVMVMMMMVL